MIMGGSNWCATRAGNDPQLIHATRSLRSGKAFSEAARVLRTGGRLCIINDSEDILRNRQAQSVYFPETIAVELSRYPAIDLLRSELMGPALLILLKPLSSFPPCCRISSRTGRRCFPVCA